MNLQRSFKLKVQDDLVALSGEEFERFCKHVLELELGEKIIHKGQNLYAKPVGYTADFANTQYEIIGQSGTDQDYFEDFKKPMKDIQSALKNHSTAETIYLFSNRYAGTSRLGDLLTEAKNNKINKKILTYDAEKIADTILNKIFASHITEEIFQYLPSAYELFKILPQNAQIPAHKDIYYERIEEEAIISKLACNPIVQVYGLSGIGKTELTISLAKKLSSQFETLIWIDGDSYQNSNLDFNAIKVSKFDRLINLSTILESYRSLIIFDNINHHTDQVQIAFQQHNKKDSRCIISSLSRTLSEDFSFHLTEVSEIIAKKILFDSDEEINEKNANIVLHYSGKHPLVLKIINSVVKNGIFDWDSLISELSDIHQLTDNERNQTIADRIIGRIKRTIEKELASLRFLNNRLISKSILENLIGRIGITKLLNNTIIGKNDNKYFSIHQIILDSVKTEVPNNQWQREFTEKVKNYLLQHNETKDIAFYNFIFNHSDLLKKIQTESNDRELKRVIIYSFIQCTDFKNKIQTDSLVQEAQLLIDGDNDYYEHLLLIELAEIRLFAIDKKKESDLYNIEAIKEIERLTKLVPHISDKNHKTTLLHHIGKYYFKVGQNKTALEKFNEVLSLKPNDPFALLQIARISSVEKNAEEVKRITKDVFGFSDCPLSILLSFYELISYSNYSDLRADYIDKKIDKFVSKIIDAIDSRYDQPYNILSKLSGHLSYNFPIYFEMIINSLPVPANIDLNDTLRFNYAGILVSYFKYLKYNGDKELDKPKMQKTLSLAKVYFESANLNTDFKKSTYIDLLIEAEEFVLAEKEVEKFEDKNAFVLQKLSKIYRGQSRFPEAIDAAENAIALYQSADKVQPAYLAAFLNDKAEAENADNIKNCINTLDEAISKQTSPKTREEWSTKLKNWKEKYRTE